jgi:hypothetical protein
MVLQCCYRLLLYPLSITPHSGCCPLIREQTYQPECDNGKFECFYGMGRFESLMPVLHSEVPLLLHCCQTVVTLLLHCYQTAVHVYLDEELVIPRRLPHTLVHGGERMESHGRGVGEQLSWCWRVTVMVLKNISVMTPSASSIP